MKTQNGEKIQFNDEREKILLEQALSDFVRIKYVCCEREGETTKYDKKIIRDFNNVLKKVKDGELEFFFNFYEMSIIISAIEMSRDLYEKILEDEDYESDEEQAIFLVKLLWLIEWEEFFEMCPPYYTIKVDDYKGNYKKVFSSIENSTRDAEWKMNTFKEVDNMLKERKKDKVIYLKR